MFALLLFKQLWYKYILCWQRDYSYTSYQTDNLLSSLMIFCACWPFPGTFWLLSCVRDGLGKVTPSWLCLTATVVAPCAPRANFKLLLPLCSHRGGPLLTSGKACSCEQLHAVQACATTGWVHGGHAMPRLQIKGNGHGGCIKSYFKVWHTEMKVNHNKLVVKLNNPHSAEALTWSDVPSQ